MPSASELFPQLDQLDPITLYARYEELSAIPVHPEGLQLEGFQTDAHLMEMISILGILRRKSSGPPKAKRPKTIVPAPKASLDML